jgi:hypothetical protein
MRSSWCVYLLLLTAAYLAAPNALVAQSIMVSPSGYFTIAVKQSLQFTANVTGLSNTAVTWSVAGVTGGNATAGTITSTGLYTAPANLPGQNPVTITAVSVTSNKNSGMTYAYLIGMGPTITSVPPNPFPVGSYTVTIQGTGFMPYANITNNGVQLSTSSLTATTITASGWQGNVGSASLCVTNPGTTCSNTLTVPVGVAGPPTYTLTVMNGTGSGSYKAGAVVNISANGAPSGQMFTGWTGANVANANAASTTITMPASNAVVTANYGVAAVTYALTVVNGVGSGSYAAGTVVNISTGVAPAGQAFLDWTGAAVANASTGNNTITMPASPTTVTANFFTPMYSLTVNNGTITATGLSNGSFAQGTVVAISASAAPANQFFQSWTGAASRRRQLACDNRDHAGR